MIIKSILLIRIIRFYNKIRKNLVTYRIITDPPENVTPNLIYLVKDNTDYWLAVFKCPCGCDAVIQLNLLSAADPNWRFKIDKQDRISIFPSVWRNTGCKSHFTLRKGKIFWVR